MDVDQVSISHVLHVLERIEIKLEKMAETDLTHANEIRVIKAELHQSIEELEKRLTPVETWYRHFDTGSKFLRWLVGLIVAAGGVVSALALFKDRLW